MDVNLGRLSRWRCFDRFPQVGLVVIAPPTITHEGDVAGGELGDVEDGTMVWLIEEYPDFAAAFRAGVLKEDGGEWGTADAVAVVGDIDDGEFHTRIPFSLWAGIMPARWLVDTGVMTGPVDSGVRRTRVRVPRARSRIPDRNRPTCPPGSGLNREVIKVIQSCNAWSDSFQLWAGTVARPVDC